MLKEDSENLTFSSPLWQNPKIKQAKQLLLEAVKEESQKITGIRPPNPKLKQSYEKLLNEFNACRGATLRYPYIGTGVGRGPLVELLDGSVKYDFITGIGVHFFGHSYPALIESSIDSAISDTIMQGN